MRDNLALAVATSNGAARWLLRDTLADRGIAARIEEAAARVALLDLLDRPVAAISYGARRQLEVGLALAARPRMLLMDEPTSGVGPEMIKAFNRLLRSLPRDMTVLIIEHDMDLVFRFAQRITVLVQGQVLVEGTPSEIAADKRVRDVYLGEATHG